VQEFSLETTEGTLPVVMLLDWRTGQPLPVGPALDRVPNALRWGALWFSVIHKGRRDGVADRIQVLPGRWPEAPSGAGSTAVRSTPGMNSSRRCRGKAALLA
jgi:hypothetical protein